MRVTRNLIAVAGILIFMLAFIWTPAEAEEDIIPGSYKELTAREKELYSDPPLHAPAQASHAAMLDCPYWRIWITDYGYSDVMLAKKWRYWRYWPWYWWWHWEEMLSGEWAAAIYYDQVQTPPIQQGPNAGTPQKMWLEPNFVYPNWTTNSGFWVVIPITSDQSGPCPPPYLDHSYSMISNGQVDIEIECWVHCERTAMGRCGLWPWQWRSYVWSDPCILQQFYTITNISTGDLTNMEFVQFLHGHPGDHDAYGNLAGWLGNWEVYDPTLYWPPPVDNFGMYHYDITQWGRKYRHVWPWPYYYWWYWGYEYIGMHSQVAPSSQRSPTPWGLGDYVGHAPGKPARPGVHWDVEENNLNPQGLAACQLYPGGVFPIFGSEVAGAMEWYLTSNLGPGISVQHDVLLTIANRPYHGWHWGFDWWHWYYTDWVWPYWKYPSVYYWHHPWGWPWYRIKLGWPWWWNCYYWPPVIRPFWFGVALPVDMVVQHNMEPMEVYFVANNPAEPRGPDFVPDPMVTDDLNLNHPWPDYEWFGFSIDGYELPDSMMIVYCELGGEMPPGQSHPTFAVQTMMGDAEYGWAPYAYDSTCVCPHTLAATLTSFSAKEDKGGVEVAWTTVSEIDFAGFNVLRSTTMAGEQTKLNASIIAAEGGLGGAEYLFRDEGAVDGLAYYWLESVDLDGSKFTDGPVKVGDGKEEPAMPGVFALSQNYPNPFNPTTEIKFDLPVACYVTLEIYNVAGQRVATLVNEDQKAGAKIVRWDAKDDNGVTVSSGVYFYKLQAGDFVEIKKMVLLR